MQPEEAYEIWAPFDSIWSKWAKPGIFTCPTYIAAEQVNLSDLPDLYNWHSSLGDTLVIINLPGVETIKYGLALANQGYRPVPLFNSIDGPGAVLNVRAIKSGLMEGAEMLRTMNISLNAPPAFLLDSKRMEGHPTQGDFDNRWVVFPQDFPSSTFLLAHGIKRVILVQLSSSIDRDLGQVLAFWKRSGIEIMLMNRDGEWTPRVADNLKPINRFNFARAAFGAFLIVSLGLRRSNAGGFGSIIPSADRFG
jgi:hypothetical protein